MAEEKCPLCEDHPLLSDATKAMNACPRCAKRLGIIPMPPSPRQPAPCSCGSQQFVRVIPREYSSGRSGDHQSQVSAPMYATYVPKTDKTLFGVGYTEPVEIEEAGAGLLELHICRGCGVVRWNCIDVENIPIGPHFMTEVVDVGGAGPFR